MANLRPYLFSTDARKQADFYREALGGEIVSLKTFAEMPGADEAVRDRVYSSYGLMQSFIPAFAAN